MKIIANGDYPNDNIMECEDCHCLFQYYNEEIIIRTSTDLEMDTFGGYGVHKYIICPQCNHNNTISCDFYEDENIFDTIINRIKKIFKKKKESNDNGQN